MTELDEIEFDILDAIYFVEPFEHIVEECREKNKNVIADTLKQMIHKKWVSAMVFSEEKNDFVRSFIYDTDDMNAYHYLATKEGLLVHNGK